MHAKDLIDGADQDRDRTSLRTLARSARGGVISLERAAEALGRTNRDAARTLGGLIRRGWLVRVRRGLYLVLPIEADALASAVVDDPWLLATHVYAPCYIGGWSAAEHWGLTEQLFRSTFVVSAGRVRRREQSMSDVSFYVVQVQAPRVESVASIWRGGERVAVSDPARTIADALAAPSWLGGIRHLAEILEAHCHAPSWNPARLLEALDAVGTGVAYKRLGFLAESLELDAPELILVCLARRTAGLSKLDPEIPEHGRIMKRWGLYVNAMISKGGGRE